MNRFFKIVIGVSWLIAGCWLMPNTVHQSRSGLRPNVAEIPGNLKIMRAMGTPRELQILISCESDGVQHNTDGSVLRGNVDSDDIGMAQINLRHHGLQCQRLGFDIYTVDGNLHCANYIYKHEGPGPWSASRRCLIRKSSSIASNR